MGQEEVKVALLLEQVRLEGDAALLRLSEAFDGVRPDPLRVPETRLQEAWEGLPPPLREALTLAHGRILAFHQQQRPADLAILGAHGERLGRRWRPVERAGLYVPGGRAAYPSTVLMNAVPAQVGGRQHGGIGFPNPARGGHQLDALHPRHLRGDGVHQHGAGVGSSPPWHVKARPFHGPPTASETFAMGSQDGQVHGPLLLVEREDAAMGQGEGLLQGGGEPLPRFLQPGFRHLEGVRADAIKGFAEAQKSGVPFQPHLLEQVGHLLLLLTHLTPLRAGSDLLEPDGGSLEVSEAGEDRCPGRSPGGGMGGDHGERNAESSG